MFKPDLQTKLLVLDYSIDWINTGILNESELGIQLQEFYTGEDTNKEHYRFRTIMAYLKNDNSLDDTQVEHIIRLLQNDPDEAMARSALIGILKRKSLTSSQFSSVNKALTLFSHQTEKRVNESE